MTPTTTTPTSESGSWVTPRATHSPTISTSTIGGTFWPCRGIFGRDELRYVPDLPFGEEGEYLTGRLTDEALKVIDRLADRPFVLHMCRALQHGEGHRAPPEELAVGGGRPPGPGDYLSLSAMHRVSRRHRISWSFRTLAYNTGARWLRICSGRGVARGQRAETTSKANSHRYREGGSEGCSRSGRAEN